ncbi:hypothetical protein FQR65_LT12180 [Abscondita terminalis]|nr:hypothetical protein FQR65_LT12180 [Abscondita terminalis]
MRSILLFILVAVQNGHLVTSVSQEQLNMVDDYSNKHPETNSFSQKSLDSLYELSKVKYNGNYQRIPTVEEITGLSQKDLDSIRNLPDLSDVIKVEDPYQPPNHVNYGFNNKTFWRNYGIHFAIGAAG